MTKKSPSYWAESWSFIREGGGKLTPPIKNSAHAPVCKSIDAFNAFFVYRHETEEKLLLADLAIIRRRVRA